MKEKRAKQGGNDTMAGGEELFIRRIAGVAAVSGWRNGIELGIGDDAAIWKPRSGFETVLTCDWFLEGSHFLRDVHPADAIGWKCLARAVSDIAAMGGEPRCFLLSLALPETFGGGWLSKFLAGLKRASRKLDCALAGGDTTRSQQILIHVTVIGEVRKGLGVLRSEARPGDRIFVSGKLGEAELGLKLIQRDLRAGQRFKRAMRKHLYPEPRLALGQWLGKKRIATAMMDLSDGLSSDLRRLCEASKVGAKVHSARIPLASKGFPDIFGPAERLQAGLHGGDDYELLFCVGKKDVASVPRTFSGVELTEIGEITRERKMELIGPSGQPKAIFAAGWDPFRK